jgi:hypothetical protein
MEKKGFETPDDIRREFRKVRQDSFMNPENMRRFMHLRTDNEVKLFTDKNKMVEYVNQLIGIENVEIFKIEDQLYKVLVSRKHHEKECCKEHSEK